MSLDTIFRVKFGSHLYGTATPESDEDWKAVHLPAARDILLQRAADSVRLQGRAKAEGERNTKDDVDEESYALHRYLRLLAEGQTVAIDMLFAPREWTLANGGVWSADWQAIVDNRYRLLTKRSTAFVGYCRQQANKYGIKGSRVAAAKRAAEFFASAVERRGSLARVGDFLMDFPSDEHTMTISKETSAGNVETYFVCCNRMVGFKNTVKEAAIIYRRVYEEYGDRARKAQSNEGVDWKALSHAVRVGHEALDLLRHGEIWFPLPDAHKLLAIKRGELPYARVAEEIEGLLSEVEEASAVSDLRDEADQDWIDGFVTDVYGAKVREPKREAT